MLVLALVAPMLAGCLASQPGDTAEADADLPEGHPYPSDDAWPDGLTGPFEVAKVTEHRIESFDGTGLEGWIVHPDVPNGTEVPIVLWSSPYFGQCNVLPPPGLPEDCHYPLGDDPEGWDNSNRAEATPVRLLVEHGYAVAIWSVRGTGNSGGCFTWFGPAEQRDHKVLVDWLGNRSWSNGRVGMMGLSYHGTTPWEAAIMNPEPLKTIVPAGIISDSYQFFHTPQGAPFTIGETFNTAYVGRVSLTPPVNAPIEHWTVEHAPVLPDRACPEVVRTLAEAPKDHWTDHRSGEFWRDRRLIDGFPNITSSVFLVHGLQDLWGSGHQQQEDPVWNALDRAPARMLVGQWGHEYPNFNHARDDYVMEDWNATLLAWLDYWLKGIGDGPPKLGVVEYQDSNLGWHASAAWPPAEARDEVLFLQDEALATRPGDAAASFRSVPVQDGPSRILCRDGSGVGPPPGRAFVSEPVGSDVLVAGNPMAYLNVESDLPGGLVAVHLFDLGTDFACSDGRPEGVRKMTVGVADLRFHEGSYMGEDFPTGEPTAVRIDLANIAEVLEEGHRLAAVVSYGEPISRTSQPYYPQITLHGGDAASASQLVVPVVDGTLSGMAPVAEYPPRPFVPSS